jgi:hypothetical protein
MHRLILVALLTFAIQPGCGESQDVVDKFPDDIDTSLTLDDIGEAGLNKICSTFEGWVLDQYSSTYWVQATCMAAAVDNNEDAGSCGDELQACLDDPPPEVEALIDSIQSQAGCSAIAVEATGCSATVGQVEDCLDALGAALDNVKFTLTCAAAGETLDPDWWVISIPSACTSIEAGC